MSSENIWMPGKAFLLGHRRTLWLVQPGIARNVARLLLTLLTLLAYGYAIAEVSQAVTGAAGMRLPDFDGLLLGLLGAGYVTHLMHRADSQPSNLD